MERTIKFYPAYDKRSSDPKKNYGIGSATLGFYLIGELGAIQFTTSTGWNLDHVHEELKHKHFDYYDPLKPQAYDLGYHSPNPMYEDYKPMSEPCEFVGGKPCYYDGSTLNAEPILKLLITQGSDAVWKELEDYYIQTFGELK